MKKAENVLEREDAVKIIRKADKTRKKITKMSEAYQRHSKDAVTPNGACLLLYLARYSQYYSVLSDICCVILIKYKFFLFKLVAICMRVRIIIDSAAFTVNDIKKV